MINIGVTFWNRFELLRPGCGNKSEVARKLGLSATTVGGWDNVKTEPKKRHLKSIKKLYNLSCEEITYLILGEGPAPPKVLHTGGGTPAQVGEDAAGTKRRA